MCKHEKFVTESKITRLHDEGKEDEFRADISIHCAECLKPFEFVGLPLGYSSNFPTANLDRTELRTPIKPII